MDLCRLETLAVYRCGWSPRVLRWWRWSSCRPASFPPSHGEFTVHWGKPLYIWRNPCTRSQPPVQTLWLWCPISLNHWTLGQNPAHPPCSLVLPFIYMHTLSKVDTMYSGGDPYIPTFLSGICLACSRSRGRERKTYVVPLTHFSFGCLFGWLKV